MNTKAVSVENDYLATLLVVDDLQMEAEAEVVVASKFRLVMLPLSLPSLPIVMTVCDKLALELHHLPLNIPIVKARLVEVERQERTLLQCT